MENKEDKDDQVKIITVIKYSSYTESQRRANEKYRLSHKDKINGLNRKYYEERKIRDPDFLEKKREKAKEYYQSKKLKKMQPEISVE